MDDTTAFLIRRGSRLIELLKQKQYSPYPVLDQVWSLFSGVCGILDFMDIESIKSFEDKLLFFVNNCSVVEPLNEFIYFNLKEDKDYYKTVISFVNKYSQFL